MQWDKQPWGELWSIQTMPDEPSMLVIDNMPATREEALRFPRVESTTAASSLEKTLLDRFKNRHPGFWDMQLFLNEISADHPPLWREHAARARALDPYAGQRTRSMSPASALELDVRMILDGTSWRLNNDEKEAFKNEPLVTPERLHAWSAINAEIVRATGLDLRCG